ncbi:MAG: HD domain-containing protein [Candidatus Zambryskibacteria bacterium]|nr:HD domain-containing protein [Candidatus Zambryskibacteria bacterium]
MKSDRNIDFLYEIGSLRNIPRAWQQILTGKVQNISEHLFRVTIIAWMIAIAEKADTEKVIKIALIHDTSESRTGDIAFMHRNYVVRHEELAEADIFKNTLLEKEAKSLLKEYTGRTSLEARIVKDADNLDVDLELKELSKIGDSGAIGMQKQHRPTIRAKKLYTKTAKKMWDDIQKISPNGWHETLTGKWVQSKKSAK